MSAPAISPIRTPRAAIWLIIVLSLLASGLICYLAYFHAPLDVGRTSLRFLPMLNAALNLLCAISLVTGYVFIRRRRIPQHRAAMLTALVFSIMFLASYLTNLVLHGESHFDRLSPWWPYYWKLLASHIMLSVVALPLILATFYLALTGRFRPHKKIARITLPVWLYVSLSGVTVYLLQAWVH